MRRFIQWVRSLFPPSLRMSRTRQYRTSPSSLYKPLPQPITPDYYDDDDDDWFWEDDGYESGFSSFD